MITTMRRSKSLGIATLMAITLLVSCTDDSIGPECDCPFFSAEISVECDPCDVNASIDVIIKNNWEKPLFTSVCKWRLLGSTGERTVVFGRGLEEIQRLDCSNITVGPMEIEPHSSGVLEVVLDEKNLPDLTRYAHFRIAVDFEWGDQVDPKTFELLTEAFMISQ